MLDILFDLLAGWVGGRLPWGCVVTMIVGLILLVGVGLWFTM